MTVRLVALRTGLKAACIIFVPIDSVVCNCCVVPPRVQQFINGLLQWKRFISPCMCNSAEAVSFHRAVSVISRAATGKTCVWMLIVVICIKQPVLKQRRGRRHDVTARRYA